jgi:hypothetical protein
MNLFLTKNRKTTKLQILLLFCFFSLNVLIFAQSIAVDYSLENNWAVLPGKYPKTLEKYGIKTKYDSVDVFYVYPTLLPKSDSRWNVSIEDEDQREKVLNAAIQFQASAWSEAGNIYAPYYRQANLKAYFELENGGKEALLFAYDDVKAAFAYYLEHYNHGKPIILAGHSQGSTHLGFILRDFFDGTPLQKQLIAAYIPGIGFEREVYKHIPFLEKPDQTGGFVTWNTFKRKFDDRQYTFYKGKAVINPVTWDTTQLAKRNLHKGFLFQNGKMYSKSFNTHLANGVVWISIPHFPYRIMSFKMKNYHVGDINLFWEDIHQNSLVRVESYFKNKTLEKK